MKARHARCLDGEAGDTKFQVNTAHTSTRIDAFLCRAHSLEASDVRLPLQHVGYGCEALDC